MLLTVGKNQTAECGVESVKHKWIPECRVKEREIHPKKYVNANTTCEKYKQKKIKHTAKRD